MVNLIKNHWCSDDSDLQSRFIVLRDDTTSHLRRVRSITLGMCALIVAGFISLHVFRGYISIWEIIIGGTLILFNIATWLLSEHTANSIIRQIESDIKTIDDLERVRKTKKTGNGSEPFVLD